RRRERALGGAGRTGAVVADGKAVAGRGGGVAAPGGELRRGGVRAAVLRLLRIALAAPRKASANDVNGTCGRLSKTVVSWPVAGSGVDTPGSLILSPDAPSSMSTNSRKSCVGVGWPRNTLPISGWSISGVTIS